MSAFEMADSGPWTLGTLVWLPISVVLVAAFLAGGVWLARKSRDNTLDAIDRSAVRCFSVGAYVVALVVAVCTLAPGIGMYPYKGEYHQWREVSGTVEKIDRRLIGSGKSMEDKFVVRFADSDGAQFGCDDTRCASVEPGDGLTLTCKRSWQYTGTDGYDCRFVATEATS